MKIGWYFNVGRKEFFVESNQQNKTRKFAEKILETMKVPVTDGNISFLLYSLIKANLEIKHCPACPDLGVEEHDYYNIFGKNFSGYGSENINDGMTVILTVN